jgi:hypothetical protein
MKANECNYEHLQHVLQGFSVSYRGDTWRVQDTDEKKVDRARHGGKQRTGYATLVPHIGYYRVILNTESVIITHMSQRPALHTVPMCD